MDWLGDPNGTAFMAVMALAMLALVAIGFAHAIRAKRREQAHQEFLSAEPRREEDPWR